MVVELKKGEKVLDISCGTGIVSFQSAAQIGPSGEMVGTDISDKMIETATKNAAGFTNKNISFLRMKAEKLDFKESRFDVALNALGLMYYPDPELALKEMYRVLVSGGRGISGVWGSRNNCGWSEIFPIVDSRVNTEVCPLFFLLGTGETLVQIYKQAGFSNVQSKKINTLLHYSSEEDAVKAIFAGGPVAMAYSRFDEATKLSAHKDYLHSIEKFKKDGAYSIPGEFIVVSGIKKIKH